MKLSEYSSAITQELASVLSLVSDTETDALVDAILSAKRVFVAGAGRSLLMIRGLAMRLMQTGFTTYVVGETVTPAIGEGDLLVIASGSGETGTLKVMASKALEHGAKLALITIYPDSTIGKQANYVVRIAAPTSKSMEDHRFTSIQPGASLFEQSVLLLCDGIVLRIGELLQLQNQNVGLMKLHANLE